MGLLKSLFSSKPNHPYDLSDLKVDMHSHLIPGIDDGSQSMDQTIGMLLRFVELGYKKVITTPHIMQDHYPNTPDVILSGLETVKLEIEKHKIPIEIEAAAEYYFDEFLLKKIETDKLLTFGDNYVLFEFSFVSEPHNIDQLIFDFKTHNYKPVLAHFERYMYFLEDGLAKAENLKDKGVKIQMNLNSLTGHYGKPIQKQAELLIDNKLVDFVGTDCHRSEHLDILEKNLKNPYFHKLESLNLLNRH
ncbi:MAG: CpsB/CapC family capsule biosynthesis tyrosine phosphatase, partial [Brumimicrobium sp.]